MILMLQFSQFQRQLYWHIMKSQTQKLFRNLFLNSTILLMIVACASSTTSSAASSGTLLYNEWTDDDYSHSEVYIKQVLVVGAFNDLENRKALEKTFIDNLANIDVGGFSSLDFMSVDSEINRDNVLNAIEGQPVDGVLVTELVQYDEATFNKGSNFADSYADYSTSKQYFESIGKFDSNARDLNDPGNFTVIKTVMLKIGLYNLKKDKLVWSANSRSIEPESANEVIQAFTQQVIARLREENLI
jgi:hypothetical protein